MLCLTRKIGQSVTIQHPDGEIRIVIRHVKGTVVGVGVEAPKSVRAIRSELVTENAASAINTD